MAIVKDTDEVISDAELLNNPNLYNVVGVTAVVVRKIDPTRHSKLNVKEWTPGTISFKIEDLDTGKFMSVILDRNQCIDTIIEIKKILQ